MELGSKSGIAEGLEGMAWLVGTTGQPERGARLFGAASALRETAGLPLPPFARAMDKRSLSAVREQMNEDVFAKAWAEGREMTMEQAIAYASDAG